MMWFHTVPSPLLSKWETHHCWPVGWSHHGILSCGAHAGSIFTSGYRSVKTAQDLVA